MKKQAVLVFPKILIIPLSILLFAKSASAAGPHRPPRSVRLSSFSVSVSSRASASIDEIPRNLPSGRSYASRAYNIWVIDSNLLLGDQSPLNFSDIGSSSLMTSSGAGHGEMTGDKLVLRGLKFHGYHGVKEEERKLGQKFLVDVDAWMDLQPAGNSDCLSDTISYTAIYRIVKEVMEGAPHNLLESVTQSIASTILDKFPQISTVRIVLGKPHVAVLGSVDYLGVEIVRHRNKVVQS